MQYNLGNFKHNMFVNRPYHKRHYVSYLTNIQSRLRGISRSIPLTPIIHIFFFFLNFLNVSQRINFLSTDKKIRHDLDKSLVYDPVILKVI